MSPDDASRQPMDDRELDEAERMLDEIREGYEEKRKHLQPGECPGCGAFRLDGQPPQIHEHDCPLASLVVVVAS